jgi:spore maturation protein CgeB
MTIVILGLSITSSWGNGHATTYRALVRALAARGHAVRFLERDVPWYAAHRDLASPGYCDVRLYGDLATLEGRHAADIRDADLVIVGSYVPDGVAVADLVLQAAAGVTAFYDIDTPVTLAKLAGGGLDYLAARQIPHFDLYLSFTGGAALSTLQTTYGARHARPLYCSVDPDVYYPDPTGAPPRWDLGYLGTYSEDRQPVLERLMLTTACEWPAGRFVVAGPQYPAATAWPANVERIEHLPPAAHRRFYTGSRFTLNVTRGDMARAGFSPSVRLFEAAACGVPIISDHWRGLDRFFTPAAEILISSGPRQTRRYLRDLPDADRLEIGRAARARVLREHTAAHRAAALEAYVREAGFAGAAGEPADVTAARPAPAQLQAE